MGPDGRGIWFADGCFPTPVNGISINAEVSSISMAKTGFAVNSDSNYGILDKSSLYEKIEVYSGYMNSYQPRIVLVVTRVEISGFEIKVEELDGSYDAVAQLQLKLLFNNFSAMMLVDACVAANATTIADVHAVADSLDAEMTDVIDRHGMDAAIPYLSIGVTSPAAIDHSIINGIDPELALSVSR